MTKKEGEWGTLQFTVDYPALYSELIMNNLEQIGPGCAMGLRLVLLGLKKIAQVAVAAPETHGEILQALADLSIVTLDGKE